MSIFCKIIRDSFTSSEVKIQLDQTLEVTRNAFHATLKLDNEKDTPFTDVGMQIIITDGQGNNVTDLFDISSPDLTGLTAVDGTGTLAADTDGQAVFTIIPTDAAAPTTSEYYFVSAVLTYQVDGEDLAIPFAAQTINVDPSPDLTLRYFEQEFVYGPDPTNPSAPSEPFALGVQVVNTGAGTANDVSITSAQPEIVDNEKGLLINFQVIATQVDGQSLSPSLTANFGDIDPGDVGTGVFLMTSSLQGQFIDYSASFEDESGLGTPQLAIISSIEIHQLLHLASEVGPGASTGTAFLVDDNPGADTNPTAIYLPDGSTAPVSEATDVETEGTLGNGDLQIQLTYTTTSGWNYLSIPDPGNGQYELVSVTRSDGVTLPANDYWQTDRTFIGGGRPPIYENMLQILDDNGTGTYTLTYVPINQTHPAVTSISSVSPNPTTTPVGSLQVTFNEPIALGTFNFDDLSLTLNNGPNLIALTSGVTVSLVSGSTYQISGLGALDAQPGVYSLTVNASGIEDSSGNVGTGSDSTSWVEAAGEPAVLTITGVTPGLWNTPVDSVSVTFTQPIDTGSFGLSALSLTEDGGSNLITSNSGVSITQEGPATFQVTGLSSLTTSDGDYVLTVDASQVTSNGIPGVGSGSVAWTMDTTPPLVEIFASITSPRNTPLGSVDVTFSKLIDPTTFTASALSLTLNGGINLINGGVTVTLVSGSTYQISGLAALDAANGTYTLTVNGADVSDLAGNAGTNSLSTFWVESTSLPAAPTDLAISPNTGISPGLTDTGAVTLTGSLGATGLTVDVFDVTTNTDLGDATVTGQSFSIALNLSIGANQLLVTAEDAAGNTSPTSIFNAFIDETSPTISSFAPVSPNPTNTAVASVDVTFSKPINLATFAAADLSLTDNGGANLITSAVTISLVSGSTYAINGLAGLTAAEGTYLLMVNAAGLQDQAGNTGTGSLSTSWLMDTTPPTSSVSALPSPTTSTSFLVTATGSDSSGSNGSTPSGIAIFDIFVSTDSGPFTLLAQVTPSDPSALFTGQAGNTYGFYSVATDNAGNVQATPTAAQVTVQVLFPLSVSSLMPVSPNPRNTPVAEINVSFNMPISTTTLTSADLSLTDNGGPNLITGSLSITRIMADTYLITGLAGLTSAEGSYSLTINAAGILDQYGNPGTGSMFTSWLMDTTPSTSTVNPLPQTTTSTTFTVSVSGSDPIGSNGSPPSGIASFALYVSEDGGPFTSFATVTPASPSAPFTGQVGHAYGFYSIATDKAGNVQPTPSAAQATVQIVNPLSLTAIATVSPNPRNTTVSAIDVTFSVPINTRSLSPGALTLTDDGGANLINSGVSISLVSGDMYAIGGLAGLTQAQGLYTLTVNAADIHDQYGNLGSDSLSTSWLMDTTPPTSTVSPLPKVGNSLVFPVTVTGTVPTEPAGSPTVYIASFAVYVSTNGGAWTLWQTLTPSSGTPNTASANYPGKSNTVYAFYSVATDNAGNTQAYKPSVEASTDLPYLNTPATQVTSSSTYHGDGTFTLNLSGTDAGGSGLAYFEVYVAIGAGTPVLIGPAVPAGVANSSGTYQTTTTYLMPSSNYGISNTYKFYSVGIDAAGLEEPMHAMYDISFTKSYTEPAASQLTVSSLTVENGAAERTYIRYLDVNFNDATNSVLQAIINSVNNPTTSNPAELTLTQNNLTDSGTPASVSLKGLLAVIDNAIEIDFGTGGIGGNSSTTTADGYYTLTFSPLSGQGQAATHHFYRLLGDVDGDGTVNQNDLNEIAAARGQSLSQIAAAIGQTATGLTALSMDVNGDGSVNTTDLALATKSKGNSLKGALLLG